MKSSEDVVTEFNSLVNMTADELETWLKSDDSRSAGWPKSEGEPGGESIGHDSGRKIVEILRSNPKKDESKYTEDQVKHMRKVVSYCKRHMAQEQGMLDSKSEEEVKKTKSWVSSKCLWKQALLVSNSSFINHIYIRLHSKIGAMIPSSQTLPSPSPILTLRPSPSPAQPIQRMARRRLEVNVKLRQKVRRNQANDGKLVADVLTSKLAHMMKMLMMLKRRMRTLEKRRLLA